MKLKYGQKILIGGGLAGVIKLAIFDYPVIAYREILEKDVTGTMVNLHKFCQDLDPSSTNIFTDKGEKCFRENLPKYLENYKTRKTPWGAGSVVPDITADHLTEKVKESRDRIIASTILPQTSPEVQARTFADMVENGPKIKLGVTGIRL